MVFDFWFFMVVADLLESFYQFFEFVKVLWKKWFYFSEKGFRTHWNHVVSLFLQSQWQWNDYRIIFGDQQKTTSCFRRYLTEKYNSQGNLSTCIVPRCFPHFILFQENINTLGKEIAIMSSNQATKKWSEFRTETSVSNMWLSVILILF